MTTGSTSLAWACARFFLNFFFTSFLLSLSKKVVKVFT